MKKLLLILAVVLSAASANAQFKDSGFKTIGELGLGFNWCRFGTEIGSASAFGMITPTIQASFGSMLCSQVYLGGGIGYAAYAPVSTFKEAGFSKTVHGLKLFAHARFYTATEGNGVIIDTKLGYQKAFGGYDINMFDFFVGPGYLFSDRYAITVGYAGSVSGKDSYGTTMLWHGPAVKFSLEF